METAPRNCRFLSLVVVELVLTQVERLEGVGKKPQKRNCRLSPEAEAKAWQERARQLVDRAREAICGSIQCISGMLDGMPCWVQLVTTCDLQCWETGGILFREYCFGEENSLSSAVNSVSSATNSVSSCLHTNNRLRGTH